MALDSTDFLIIGGGIIGVSIARELKRRHNGSRVTLIEKENAPGLHASGRNSGVLHAGFYYSPDSLKARFTRVGNATLADYCAERRIPILRCGKLVVPRNDEELLRLEALYRRGLENGVELQMVTAAEAREIEPRAKVHQQAIWSPTTASVDSRGVMAAMHQDATREGVDVRCATAYRGRRAEGVETSGGSFTAGFVVNAAGLHADEVARDFGFAGRYRILPFRGTYLESTPSAAATRAHLYPVPDPAFPFLGVHLTLGVNGMTKIGPTAAPALSREHYGGLRSLRIGEALDLMPRVARLVLTNVAVRRHVAEEVRKLSSRHLLSLAGSLASGIRPEDFHWSDRSGIRAQLYDTVSNALEMDFVIESDERSLHVLNAVSPGFTCAIPFAEHVADRIGC